MIGGDPAVPQVEGDGEAAMETVLRSGGEGNVATPTGSSRRRQDVDIHLDAHSFEGRSVQLAESPPQIVGRETRPHHRVGPDFRNTDEEMLGPDVTVAPHL